MAVPNITVYTDQVGGVRKLFIDGLEIPFSEDIRFTVGRNRLGEVDVTVRGLIQVIQEEK